MPADEWEAIVRTAHGLGIRSSSTIMFGHVDAPPHWVAHLRRIARIQSDTGGFTEFVPLPFVHRNAPIYLAGKARAGATADESLRMHAVARILLDGLIDNVQVSWVKLGVDACQRILEAGANDFGGTLMEETISRMAGAGVGDRDDARRLRRRDPRDRTRSCGANDDVRARRSRADARRWSIWLTISVNLVDRRFSCRTSLQPASQRSHDGPDGRGMRQEISFGNPLSSGAFFPQNHTHVILGGARGAPLHPLARTSEVS